MRIRNVLKEFEAHIHSVPARPHNIAGKSEWKQYGDGTYRFKVSVRNIPLPDNSQIELVLDDLSIKRLIVSSGQAKMDLEGQTLVEVPRVQAGQVLKLKFGETILAEGVYVQE